MSTYSQHLRNLEPLPRRILALQRNDLTRVEPHASRTGWESARPDHVRVESQRNADACADHLGGFDHDVVFSEFGLAITAYSTNDDPLILFAAKADTVSWPWMHVGNRE